MAETLYIKNMVCDRCIMAVRAVLTRCCGIEPLAVELGEVRLPRPLTEPEHETLRRELEDLGFELLEDRRQQLVARLRGAVIELVRHPEGVRRERLSDWLVRRLGHDYDSLSRLFSEVTGTTLEKYLIAQKIEYAKELLIYDELSLAEIADRLGYSSGAYLSAQFKSVTGMTPPVSAGSASAPAVRSTGSDPHPPPARCAPAASDTCGRRGRAPGIL